MDRFLYLWSVFLFASTALSLGIIKPITISTSPTSNLTVLQFPTLPATNLSSTSDNARCFKGSFSFWRRIHFGDCRTAIGNLPPGNPRVPLYPVEKSSKTCRVSVKPPLSIQPIYGDWSEIKNEALDLTAECKREMPSWNYFIGGQSNFQSQNPVLIKLEYNGAS